MHLFSAQEFPRHCVQQRPLFCLSIHIHCCSHMPRLYKTSLCLLKGHGGLVGLCQLEPTAFSKCSIRSRLWGEDEDGVCGVYGVECGVCMGCMGWGEDGGNTTSIVCVAFSFPAFFVSFLHAPPSFPSSMLPLDNPNNTIPHPPTHTHTCTNNTTHHCTNNTIYHCF